ncbi:hypothetical protein BH20CHL7_BH20CHL7_06420 [soil metagenome]
MLKFWSEVPSARAREVVADVATWAWVSLWAVIGLRIHDTISSFAEAGRVLQQGGRDIQGAGAALGDGLRGLPLIGEGMDDLASTTLGSAGEPFIYAGRELESLLILIARLLTLLVIGVTVIPWLSRYLPWRAERLATLRAANQAIRRAPTDVTSGAMQQALATRALSRLPYPALLEHTADPFGDFAAGHYDRLARAELASVGLR